MNKKRVLEIVNKRIIGNYVINVELGGVCKRF